MKTIGPIKSQNEGCIIEWLYYSKILGSYICLLLNDSLYNNYYKNLHLSPRRGTSHGIFMDYHGFPHGYQSSYPRWICVNPWEPHVDCGLVTYPWDPTLRYPRFRSAIAKVRYRKSPRDTYRTVKLKLTLTLVLTLTDTGGAVLTLMLGYRSLYITWQ